MATVILAHHTIETMAGGYDLHVWISDDGHICLGDRAGRELLSFPAHEWQTVVDAIEQTGVSWDMDGEA